MGEFESKVLEWLASGADDAKDIVDLPWNVQPIEKGKYLAEHPRMPFQLLLVFTGDFVKLIVPFGLETISLDTSERMKLYRVLLKLNDGVNLMKFVLSGMNDEVYLRVDLDRKTLGKDEFNDALTALFMGLLTAVSALGLEEEFQRELFDRVVAMVLERLQKGATPAEVKEFLTKKVGMDEKDAENLLEKILEANTSQTYAGGDVGYF